MEEFSCELQDKLSGNFQSGMREIESCAERI